MTSKIFRRIHFVYANGKFCGKVSRERMKINFLPFQLCHSQRSTLNDNTDIINLDEVQKFLSFIQEDSSYLKKMTGIHQDKLNHVMQLLEQRSKIEGELKSLSNMSTEGDKELEKLIGEERDKYINEIRDVNIEILENTLPFNNDEENDRSVEVQFIPAVGGHESKLFTEELYHMYLKYAEYKNWVCPIAELKGDKADLRSGIIFMSGKNVFNLMQNEGGVHRVQRVPETEKTGRTHTSTCVVMVLAQPSLTEINIPPNEIEVVKTTSSGPGGQNVNKNETSIRIKHLPTGIVVDCEDSRYQAENKKIAFERLRRKLYDIQQSKIQSEREMLKKKQMGSKDYSDKIRTYHYTQNRVTDHRINYTVYNLKGVLEGRKELDVMITKLSEASKKSQVIDYINKVFQSVDYQNFVKKIRSN